MSDFLATMLVVILLAMTFGCEFHFVVDNKPHTIGFSGR